MLYWHDHHGGTAEQLVVLARLKIMHCWPCYLGWQERRSGLNMARPDQRARLKSFEWWRTAEYKCYIYVTEVDRNLLLSCPCLSRMYYMPFALPSQSVQIKPPRPSFPAKPGKRSIRVGPLALDFFPGQIMPSLRPPSQLFFCEA